MSSVQLTPEGEASVRSFRCDECGAKPGEPCTSQYGRRLSRYHFYRREAAWRAEQGPLPPPARVPKLPSQMGKP